MKYLGQVFTPEHISDFMSQLIDVHEGDNVMDACCGTGNLLETAMKYKANCFGVELDKTVWFAATERIKGNIINGNVLEDDTQEWIKAQNITKVVMNPPYEDRYKCIEIIESVMDSVPVGTKCVFLLPDNKMMKDKKKALLSKNTLDCIVMLPRGIFKGNAGVEVSIFIFTAGVPQEKDTVAYFMEDDGMVFNRTTKERLDKNNKWSGIEKEWLSIIKEEKEHETKIFIKKDETMMWSKPISPEDMMPTREDFEETVSNWLAYKIRQNYLATNPDKNSILYKLYFGK